MLAWRRVVPAFLAGVLLASLIDAIMHGGRTNWLIVALFASVLALSLWRRTHTGRRD